MSGHSTHAYKLHPPTQHTLTLRTEDTHGLPTFLSPYQPPSAPWHRHFPPNNVISPLDLTEFKEHRLLLSILYTQRASAIAVAPTSKGLSKMGAMSAAPCRTCTVHSHCCLEFIDQHVLLPHAPEAKPTAYLAQHQLFDQIRPLAKDLRVPEYCAVEDPEPNVTTVRLQC